MKEGNKSQTSCENTTKAKYKLSNQKGKQHHIQINISTCCLTPKVHAYMV